MGLWKKLVGYLRPLWPFGKNPALWDDRKLALEYVEAAGKFGRFSYTICPEDYKPFHRRWSRWNDLEREWAIRGYKPVPFARLMEHYDNGKTLWPVCREEEEEVVFFAPESHDNFVATSSRVSLPN